VESGFEKASEKAGEAVKFKLIDRDKKGFARYCPTFARLHDRMKERSLKGAEARSIEKAIVLLESATVPVLLKMGGDDGSRLRWHVTHNLQEGTDITAAIPALVKALGGKDELVRTRAAQALEKAVNQRDQKKRTIAVNEIIKFMRSDWFQAEMERNSVAYVRIAAVLARLLDAARETERITS